MIDAHVLSPSRPVRIHGVAEARAALDAAAGLGAPLVLVSAPAAAAHAGALWFRAVVEEARRTHPAPCATHK